MAMKRKFDGAQDATHKDAKQVKLVPFPNCDDLDTDVAMTDAEPLLYSSHHIRASSNVSSASSDDSEDSPCYPSFDLYPLPFFGASGSVNTNSHNFAHYSAQASVASFNPGMTLSITGSSNCSQIPKLKVACASSIGGQRTMWSFCEQCGAISMVDSE
ncbi:hypothetical protein BDZ89DRAFT_1035669 [Hymenopellis radicata]|nr:hypothetical protein BDZ89DRAFT_1035669 [Hymenopellis radicata]